VVAGAVGLPAAMVLATALLNGVTVAPAWGAAVLAIEPPWVDERLLIQQGDWSHVRSPQVR